MLGRAHVFSIVIAVDFSIERLGIQGLGRAGKPGDEQQGCSRRAVPKGPPPGAAWRQVRRSISDALARRVRGLRWNAASLRDPGKPARARRRGSPVNA